MSGSKIIIIRLGISVKVVLMSVKKKSLIGLGLNVDGSCQSISTRVVLMSGT